MTASQKMTQEEFRQAFVDYLEDFDKIQIGCVFGMVLDQMGEKIGHQEVFDEIKKSFEMSKEYVAEITEDNK
jgi:hypothetical protein